MGLFERKSCWKKIEGRVGLAEVEFATSLEIGISFLSNLYKIVVSLSLKYYKRREVFSFNSTNVELSSFKLIQLFTIIPFVSIISLPIQSLII